MLRDAEREGRLAVPVVERRAGRCRAGMVRMGAQAEQAGGGVAAAAAAVCTSQWLSSPSWRSV